MPQIQHCELTREMLERERRTYERNCTTGSDLLDIDATFTLSWRDIFRLIVSRVLRVDAVVRVHRERGSGVAEVEVERVQLHAGDSRIYASPEVIEEEELDRWWSETNTEEARACGYIDRAPSWDPHSALWEKRSVRWWCERYPLSRWDSETHSFRTAAT